MSDFYRGEKVLVTGGSGLIGFHVVDEFLKLGAAVRTVVHRRPSPHAGRVEVVEGDLLERAACARAVRGCRFVFHAAGVSGGLKNVATNPIATFTDNLILNTLVLDEARKAGVERYCFFSNSSVYPTTGAPLAEEMAAGEAENPSGFVKKAGELQCRITAAASAMKIAIVRGGNAYGPHDWFDDELSHVMPALITKAVRRRDPYVLWGTGETRRDFTHARDIARGALFLLERHATADPVNVATGRTVSIREALDIVLDAAGYRDARVVLDRSAPAGVPAKAIDVSKMRRLGFECRISLEEGIRETVEWYRARRATGG